MHWRPLRYLRLTAAMTIPLAAIGGLSAEFATATAAAPPRRPNVILILADDLGFECLECNGGTSYKTPALDKLAGSGVRFTECHVQPLCTPTRLQLMTGQSNVRNYTVFAAMDREVQTFGHLFQRAGYATCVAGKWQLGLEPDSPRHFGFDEACLWYHTRRVGRYKNPGLDINGARKDWNNGEYGPDIVHDFAADFITRHRDRPFFLYYPMMLTHDPFDPTPDSADYNEPVPAKALPTQTRKTARQRHFGEMVEYMDKLVGKLLAHLEQQGVRDNTLILFVGDNGTGPGMPSRMGNRVVIGGKGKTSVTGTHVPLIAHWPGTSAAGKICNDLIDSTDFLPTICEAAGVPIPKDWTLDGRSFLPQVRGAAGQPREWRYAWYAPQGKLVAEFAADRNYKLYRDGRSFDLREDPDEQHPLAMAQLSGESAATRTKLQGVLDSYKDARPARLVKPARNAP